ncbi:hypothetical protein F2P81_018960 [Scophthalmus maximus]|uniref:Uncharacterized protein n=1 Tax=Scophthalmus maximus TaxID=52904 RepID=A0A6A4SBN9_SCOMX|nr:hypothetical protein F2P81_018960 [Scophthalmus maximus]
MEREKKKKKKKKRSDTSYKRIQVLFPLGNRDDRKLLVPLIPSMVHTLTMQPVYGQLRQSVTLPEIR